jgi:hypothetical protein
MQTRPLNPVPTIVAGALILIGLFNSVAHGREGNVRLSQVTFVTSPKWYFIKRVALDGPVLVFRKYSFSVIDGEISDSKNIFDFGCQRTDRYSDYLVFHLPDGASSGLENNSWIPRWRLKLALNELSKTFDAEGEYKNSSIFIDMNDQQRENLFELIAAHEIIIDYGVSEERLKIEQRTRTPDGKGNVIGFIEDFVTNALSPAIGRGRVVSFDTNGMLNACLAFKQRGRLP